jgi:hypothetical protein
MAYNFTQSDTLKGAQRGVEVRRQQMAERAVRAEIVYRAVTELDDVAPAALSAVFALIERANAEAETIEVESALDLHRVAGAAEILHRISRLASGQSTSNVAHATTDDERAERIRELRARLAQHDDQVEGQPAPE